MEFLSSQEKKLQFNHPVDGVNRTFPLTPPQLFFYYEFLVICWSGNF